MSFCVQFGISLLIVELKRLPRATKYYVYHQEPMSHEAAKEHETYASCQVPSQSIITN